MNRSLICPTVVLAGSLVFLAGCGATRSQGPTAHDIGARVRVKAEGVDQGWVAGKLLELPSDSVRLLSGDPPLDSVAVATTLLTSFERSRGRGSQAGQGAWIGLGAGALAGLILGAATYEDDCPDCLGLDPGAGGSAILGGLLFGAFGLGLGALIGANIHAEHWEPIPRPWVPGEEPTMGWENVGPDCILNC